MIRFASLDAEQRVRATTQPLTEDQEPAAGEIAIDFPADFDFFRQQDYRWVEEALVHDPLPEPELPPDYATRVAALEENLLTSYMAVAELYEMMTGGN